MKKKAFSGLVNDAPTPRWFGTLHGYLFSIRVHTSCKYNLYFLHLHYCVCNNTFFPRADEQTGIYSMSKHAQIIPVLFSSRGFAARILVVGSRICSTTRVHGWHQPFVQDGGTRRSRDPHQF